MASKINCASDLPPLTPFEFYCLDLAEEQPDNLARISLHHPEAANCLQYLRQPSLEARTSVERDPDQFSHYLPISSKRLDAALGTLHQPGNSQQAPCIHQSSITIKLLVDCCLGGVDQDIKSTPYYLPSWIEPFLQVFSQDANLNNSNQEGLSINIQKFSLVKLPVATHIHLIPIQLLPDFRVSAINTLRFEGIDLEEVTKPQICGQLLREGGLVLLKILKQPFVFQITGASATVGEYFQANAQTEITVSINHFDFRHSQGSIYKTQQQELVDLIDWTFKAKNREGICCNSTFVSGPVGIGKSTFLKSVADVFRYSRKEQVGVLEFDISQAMFEARKLDDTSNHFAKRFDFQAFMKTGHHSSYLLVIYGLHTCTEGDLKDAMLLALSRSLSSLDEKCYVLVECFDRIPRVLGFLQSHCVLLEPPTRFQRKDILLEFLSHPITPSALDMLTQSTHTYTPADLKYLATSVLSIHQCTRLDLPELMASLSLEPKAIEAWAAERAIEETARQRKPGIVSSPPSVSFEQVGGYAKTKARLNQILMLLSQVNQTHSLGLKRPSGLLLVGPSGCGKTRLAQAFASHTYRVFGHHFLSVKG
ncbi:hypothetical protein DSO57_1009993 [Entomophthora muscae]|nr:hypothetical protein DSO57_1009993 [Entomophthora muscae]